MSLFSLLYNQSEHRFRGLLRLVFVSCVMLGVYWITADLCKNIPNDYVYYLSNEVLTCVITLLVFWMMFTLLDKRLIGRIGLIINKEWFNTLFFGAVIGFFVIVVNYTILYLFGYINIQSFFYSDNSFNFSVELLGRAIGFFAVAITEEVFVRGYLLINIAETIKYKKTTQNTSILIALIATSLIFGILHLFNANATIISSINLMFIGFLFGYAYVSSGSLALPIGIHFAWNFTQAQVFGLNVSGFPPLVSIFRSEVLGEPNITGGNFGPEGGVIIIISVLIGLFLVNRYSIGQNSKKISNFVNIKTSIAQY